MKLQKDQVICAVCTLMYIVYAMLLCTLFTVNLHLEKMNAARYFGKNTVLLAFRPTKIAGKDVSHHFCHYQPGKE